MSAARVKGGSSFTATPTKKNDPPHSKDKRAKQAPFAPRHRALRNRHLRLSTTWFGLRLPADVRRVCPFPAVEFQAPRDRRKARPRLEVLEIHGIADVLTSMLFWNGWKSQAWILPLFERRVDKPASALALADPRVQFDEVPTFRNFGAKLGDERGA